MEVLDRGIYARQLRQLRKVIRVPEILALLERHGLRLRLLHVGAALNFTEPLFDLRLDDLRIEVTGNNQRRVVSPVPAIVELGDVLERRVLQVLE